MSSLLARALHLLLICGFVGLAGGAAGQGIINRLPTSQTAVLGRFAKGPVNFPVQVCCQPTFNALFGSTNPAAWPAEIQAGQFFANGGTNLYVVRIDGTGTLAEALSGRQTNFSGLYALDPLSDMRLLVSPELSLLPADAFTNVLGNFRAFLEPRRIFLVLDPPPNISSAGNMINWVQASLPADAKFCATYFPYLQITLNGVPVFVPASGAMAGLYGSNDGAHAIWKSPSGSLPLQAQAVSLALSTSDINLLVSYNVNPIRQIAGTGIVPWAARTLDLVNSANRYIPVVRTRDWAAATIERGLAYAAAQDDAAPLWTQIVSQVGNFLNTLYQEGAFAGTTPSTSYFVRCDMTTMTAADIAANRVNVLYGMALLTSGEFDLTQLTLSAYNPSVPVPGTMILNRSLGNSLTLAYPTVPGFNYTLQSTGNLRSTNWSDFAPAVSGNGAWQRPVISANGTQQFYRLRITSAR